MLGFMMGCCRPTNRGRHLEAPDLHALPLCLVPLVSRNDELAQPRPRDLDDLEVTRRRSGGGQEAGHKRGIPHLEGDEDCWRVGKAGKCVDSAKQRRAVVVGEDAVGRDNDGEVGLGSGR